MEQHSIPRQITSFEFKLIGFMTLKQFLYLVIFAPLGFIVFKLFPIPIINFILGLLVGLIGVALAFVPINDRPLEVWIRNFIKRLNSPTQFFFQKNNPPIKIFQELFFTSNPHLVSTHIESQEKLAKYLSQTHKTTVNDRKSFIQAIIQTPQQVIRPTVASTAADKPVAESQQVSTFPVSNIKLPFFTGLMKNNKKIPLPGILIYVKDANNNQVRLLKTNPHGVFATFNPLPSGEYEFEIIDPKGIYFFDKIKITIDGKIEKPIEFYSKEIL